MICFHFCLTGLQEKDTSDEKDQNHNAHCFDDWAFYADMERLSRSSSGTPRQARHRCAQHPAVAAQPTVQPRDPANKVAGSEDRLCTLAKARGLAPRATRFA